MIPLIIVFCIGLVLLVIGLSGRMVGTDPHCLECGYNLTGLTSNQCSECGTTIDSPEKLVTGRLERRWIIVLAGICVMALAAGIPALIGYNTFTQSGLYRYYPFDWVVNAAQSGSSNALNEVDRRLQSGTPDGEELACFAEAALAEQSRTVLSLDSQRWIDWLAWMEQNGMLSQQQSQRFFEQFFRLSLEIRSPIKAGEAICFAVSHDDRVPTAGLYTGQERNMSISIDDRPHYINKDGMGYEGFTMAIPELSAMLRYNGPTLKSLSPGTHTVTLQADLLLFRRTPTTQDLQSPIISKTIKLHDTVEILPPDAPDPVKLIDDPSQKTALHDAISIREIKASPANVPGQMELGVPILMGASQTKPGPGGPIWSGLPTTIGFDIIVRTSRGEAIIGMICANRHDAISTTPTGNVLNFDDKTATVILRTNREAARETMDVFQIWDGELVFENVPIVRQEQPDAANAPGEDAEGRSR